MCEDALLKNGLAVVYACAEAQEEQRSPSPAHQLLPTTHQLPPSLHLVHAHAAPGRLHNRRVQLPTVNHQGRGGGG